MSRGLGDVYKRQGSYRRVKAPYDPARINTICRVRLGEMDEMHDLKGEIEN